MRSKKINYPPPAKIPVAGGITYLVDSDSVKFEINENGEASAEATGANTKYKSYVALISQSGTDAPTAIVLQNDFNVDFVFNYGTIGRYFITVESPIFKENKTVMFTSGGEGNNLITRAAFVDENTFAFGSLSLAQDTPAPGNDFGDTTIEIRVYN